MSLSLCSPCLSGFSHPPALHLPRFLDAVLIITSHPARLHSQALSATASSFRPRASLSESDHGTTDVLNGTLLNKVAGAKDADEALAIIAERSGRGSGVVSVPEFCSIIAASLDQSNAELALSVLYAMRSSFGQDIPAI